MFPAKAVIKKGLLLSGASLVVFILWKHFLDLPLSQPHEPSGVSMATPDPIAVSQSAVHISTQCEPVWVVSGVGLEKPASLNDKALQQLIQHYRKSGYTDLQIRFTIEQSGYLPNEILPEKIEIHLAEPDVPLLQLTLEPEQQHSLQLLLQQEGMAGVLTAYADSDSEVFQRLKPDASGLLKQLLLIPGSTQDPYAFTQLLQLQPLVDTEIMQLALSLQHISVDILQQLLQLYPLSANYLLNTAFYQLSPSRFEQFLQAALLREPQLEPALDPLLEKLIKNYPAGQNANPTDELALRALQQKLIMLIGLGFRPQQASTASALQHYDRLPPELLSHMLSLAPADKVSKDKTIIPQLAAQLELLKKAKYDWPALEFNSVTLCGKESDTLFIRLTSLDKENYAAAQHQPALLTELPAIYSVLNDLTQTTSPLAASEDTHQLLMQFNWPVLLEKLLNQQSQLHELFYESTVWELLLTQHLLAPEQVSKTHLLQLLPKLHPSDIRAVYALAKSELSDVVLQSITEGHLSARQQDLLACFLVSQGLQVPKELRLSKEVQHMIVALRRVNQIDAAH